MEKTMISLDFSCFNPESQWGIGSTPNQGFMQATNSRQPTVSLCHMTFMSVALDNTCDKSF